MFMERFYKKQKENYLKNSYRDDAAKLFLALIDSITRGNHHVVLG